MRIVNQQFQAANNQEVSFRTAIIEIHLGNAAADILYLTSHIGVDLPTGAQAIHGVIKSVPVVTQQLNKQEYHSTNGNGTFTVIDREGLLTQKLREYDSAGVSIYRKKIVLRAGFVGMPFQFTEIMHTFQIENIKTNGIRYTISAYDIQRFAQKDEIFEKINTILTGNVAANATTFPVSSTARFTMNYHGSSYASEPNSTVGYFGLKKGDDVEIIAYAGKTETEFTGCIRARFGTIARQWDGLDAEGESNEIEVFEVVYLELPIAKLIYGILTGTWYANAGQNLPSTWHANVDEQWVNTASFVNIGADIWDPLDDNAGRICRFLGPDKVSAKKFIYNQLLPLIGCNLVVDYNGELNLRRITQSLPNSNYVAELNLLGIVDYSDISYEHDKILNYLRADWSYDFIKKSFLRTSAYIDQDSFAKYEVLNQKTFEFFGMHGSRHSRDFLRHLFTVMRDMSGSEPISLSVRAICDYAFVEVGDVIRLKLPSVLDYKGTASLDRTFEVESARTDWLKNPSPQFQLSGSTAKTPAIPDDDPNIGLPGYAIDNAIFSLGTNIEVAFPGAVTRSGNLVTLVSDITFVGSATLATDGILNPACVLHVDGDFQIADGVTLNWQKNMVLVSNSFIQINGQLNGLGQGGLGGNYQRTYFNQEVTRVNSVGDLLTFGVNNFSVNIINYNNSYQAAEPGFMHLWLRPQEGLCLYDLSAFVGRVFTNDQDGRWITSYNPTTYQVTNTLSIGDPLQRNKVCKPLTSYSSMPYFDIGTNIIGLPQTFCGGGGPQGGHIYEHTALPPFFDQYVTAYTRAHGSSGGNGGGGLVTISRGLDFGPNGKIVTSGSDAGTDCGQFAFDLPDLGYPSAQTENFVAGRGCGGSPGAWLCIIDGVDSTAPIVTSSKFEAYYGDGDSIGLPNIGIYETEYGSFPLRGKPIDWAEISYSLNNVPSQVGIPGQDHSSAITSAVQGLSDINYWESYHRIQYVVIPNEVIPDQDEIDDYAPLGLNIVLTETVNSPATPAGNLSTVNVYIQKPSPVLNYSHSIVEWKYSTDSAWNLVQIVAQDETTFTILADGSTIDVRARSVSTSGFVSESYIQDQITLTNVGSNQYEFDFGFNPATGEFFSVIDTVTSDVVARLSGTGGYSGKVTAGAGSSGYVNLTDRPTQLSQINATEATKLAGIAAGATVNHVYRQASAPASGMVAGDIWFETDNGNRPYVYSGSAWVDVRDAGITAALAAAADAQDTADGKIQSFFQTTAPSTGIGVGDLWFDIDDGYRLYRYTGSVWQDIQDSDIATAILAAQDAQDTADGKAVTFYSSTTPTAEGTGDLWYNTTTGVVRRWSGASWDLFSTYNDLTALNSGQDDLNFNSRGLIKAADGRPAGIYASRGQTAGSTISYLNEALGHVRLYSATDFNIAMTYPAFRVDANVKYRIRYSVKVSSAGATSGFYARMTEYDSVSLPDGVTHLYTSTREAGKEANFVLATREVTGQLSENQGLSTTWVDYEFTYTPTATAKWAALVFLKWTGIGDRELHVRLASVNPLINSNATQNTIYRQATAPASGMVAGDLWFDEDDGNHLYRYSGSAWVDTRDAGIAQALLNAQAAQDAVDGKIQTFYQTSAPTAEAIGDIWIDTDDNNHQYRWNGSSWIDIQDGSIADAIQAASDAQATADGKVATFFSSTAPTAEGVGDLWFNTTTEIVSRWNGSSWELFSSYFNGDKGDSNELPYNGSHAYTSADGTPAGIAAIWNTPVASNVIWEDKANGIIRIVNASSNTKGALYRAFRVTPNTKYIIRGSARLTSGATNISMQMYEAAGNLNDGTLHVLSSIVAIESGFTRTNSTSNILIGSLAATTSWQDFEYEYTPTPGTVWASLSMARTGGSTGSALIKPVSIVPVINSNADSTQDALDNEVTTTGGIVLDTDGAIRTTGKTSIDDAVEGVYLGDEGGDAAFYVGNGADDYIKYQEGVGLEIGKDVQIVGFAGAASKDIYMNIIKHYSADYTTSVAGTGAIVFDGSGFMRLNIPSGNVNATISATYRLHTMMVDPIKFTDDFILTMAVNIGNAPTQNSIVRFGIGATGAGLIGGTSYGYFIRSSGVYAFEKAGLMSAATETFLMAEGATGGGTQIYTIEKSGNDVKYIINGDLLHTFTIVPPVPGGDITAIFGAAMDSGNVSTTGNLIRNFGEIRFWKKAG